MKTLNCRLERLSNTMVGAIIFFIGLIFALLGLTIIPVIGLLIAIPVIILGTIFTLAPRSRACTLMSQKFRGAAQRSMSLRNENIVREKNYE